MMILKTFGVAAVAASLAWPAAAADMLFPPSVMHGAQPGAVELGSGWYIRGDVGYVDYVEPDDRSDGFADQTFDATRLEETWSAGGGFGYKFLNFFRLDATVDYRFESSFEGTSSLTGYVDESRLDRAQVDSTSGLVNAYLDLGDWYGFTPYVGAGIGAAANRIREHSAETTCLTTVCGPLGPLPAVQIQQRTSYDLAWAVMGGVAVDLGGGFKIDLGYRYINLGEVKTHATGPGAPARTDVIEAHEARLGFRYMID